jgi:hypothetical protein
VQKRLKTVSFRLSKEEIDLLAEIEAAYNAKGKTASERFRALLHALDEDLTPASMR